MSALARSVARVHLQHGYFHPDRPALPWVVCPRCRAHVEGGGNLLAWEMKPAKITAALVQALADHLDDSHVGFER